MGEPRQHAWRNAQTVARFLITLKCARGAKQSCIANAHVRSRISKSTRPLVEPVYGMKRPVDNRQKPLLRTRSILSQILSTYHYSSSFLQYLPCHSVTREGSDWNYQIAQSHFRWRHCSILVNEQVLGGSLPTWSPTASEKIVLIKMPYIISTEKANRADWLHGCQ